MLDHLLIEQSFPTPIGTVNCGLTCTDSKIAIVGYNTYDNGKSIVYNTASYIIEIITFKQRLPLYNGESVKDCQGWVWRIIKENAKSERIKLHCSLNVSANSVLIGSDSGEHLDAVAASNDKWTVHIGTEDGEVMHARALIDDWMPTRYVDELDFTKSFTSLKLNGFITHVPELTVGERIHFHYLTAYDEFNETKVNTWLAVDEFKRELENWIGVW